jgi:hypothetical protein
MQKNVASQKIGAQLVSATDGSVFTSTVTVYVTKDAGTQAIGATASGVCTHEGNGYHTYEPTPGETNADLVAFTFTGTGAVAATVQVFPRARNVPVSQVPVPELRTWTLVRNSTGLTGNKVIRMRVGEVKLFAIDFRNDLAEDGRLTDFDNFVITTGTGGGVTLDTATMGVDRTQAKVSITGVTAGTYTLTATVSFDDSDGGGEAIGVVTMLVSA